MSPARGGRRERPVDEEPALLSLFGTTLRSHLPLRSPLPAARQRPGAQPAGAELTLRCATAPPVEVAGEDGATLVWESPERDPHDQPATRLERLGEWDVLRFTDIADFHLRGGEIVVVPARDASPALVELRLVGPVLAYWLELRGRITLHASAVVSGGRSVGFLAGNHAGKSNLALALMHQGAALLTDDLLPVEEVPDEVGTPGRGAAGGRGRSSRRKPGPPLFLALPGYPQMRLWVPDAERLLPGRAQDLPPVHPAYDKRRVPVGDGGVGTFHPRPAPFAALLLPEHRPDLDEPRLEPLAPAEAVIALLAGSYLPRLAPAAGLGEGRLDLLSRLVEAVPVQRLIYPRGLDRLPETAALVRSFLHGLGS